MKLINKYLNSMYKEKLIQMLSSLEKWGEKELSQYSTDTERKVITKWSTKKDSLYGQELKEEECQKVYEKWVKFFRKMIK